MSVLWLERISTGWTNHHMSLPSGVPALGGSLVRPSTQTMAPAQSGQAEVSFKVKGPRSGLLGGCLAPCGCRHRSAGLGRGREACS